MEKRNIARAGMIAGIVSIAVNALLFGLKFAVGIMVGSLALKADAWHTLSDSISSIIIVIALRFSARKPDREHPFGHGRWTQIASLFVAVFLGVIGYEFVKQSITGFTNHETVTFGVWAIVVTVISIVAKEAMAQYAFIVAKKTDNPAIKADGWHHRSDALSSVVVLVGILLAGKLWWMDSALGLVIALMLFWATFSIMRETITKMLGAQPPKELLNQIIAEIKALHSENVQPHHFRMHDYVLQRELVFHILLDKNLTIEAGHAIAEEIENMIKKKFSIMATVHIEPKN